MSVLIRALEFGQKHKSQDFSQICVAEIIDKQPEVYLSSEKVERLNGQGRKLGERKTSLFSALLSLTMFNSP